MYFLCIELILGPGDKITVIDGVWLGIDLGKIIAMKYNIL
jgi:hypothetical protein